MRSLAALLMTAACGGPHFESGDFACSAEALCPPGFLCEQGLCVVPRAPDATTDGHGDALADAFVPLLFGTPTALDVLNSGFSEDDPTLTADFLEIYFNSSRSGNGDLYRSTRASLGAEWDPPQPVSELNTTEWNETTPVVSGDGQRLYFASNRGGNLDIYLSVRESRTATWGTPVQDDQLSSLQDDVAPFTSDDLFMILSSKRLQPEWDLFATVRGNTASQWAVPAAITELNTAAEEQAAWLSADGRRLYFTSDRTGSLGDTDFWMATRDGAGAAFAPPLPLVELNTTAREEDTWLSADERTIIFSSAIAGSHDLYVATR